MTALEQAEKLRQDAIKTLQEERDRIDEMLQLLGEKTAPHSKKRGRSKKAEVSEPTSGIELPAFQPDTTQ